MISRYWLRIYRFSRNSMTHFILLKSSCLPECEVTAAAPSPACSMEFSCFTTPRLQNLKEIKEAHKRLSNLSPLSKSWDNRGNQKVKNLMKLTNRLWQKNTTPNWSNDNFTRVHKHIIRVYVLSHFRILQRKKCAENKNWTNLNCQALHRP
jgi:hypothetical protein